MKTTVTLLILLIVFSLNTFAQSFSYTSLDGHRDNSRGVSFSPDGKTLATVNWDGTISLWEVSTSRHLRTLKGDTHSNDGVLFSSDGQQICTYGDNKFYFWDPETGELLNTLERGWSWRTESAAFSPDGKMLAIGGDDGDITLWDTTTYEYLNTLWHGRYGGGSIYSVDFSPDGQTLAGGDGTRIVLWDVTTGERLRGFGRSGVNYHSPAFSPDEQTLAFGIDDYGGDEIVLWNLTTEKRMYTISTEDSNRNITFSPDGQTLVATGAKTGEKAIHFWDATTGEHINIQTVITNVDNVVFGPDGQTLASIHTRGTIYLWKLPDTHVNIMPDTVESPAIGEQFTVKVSVVAGENVGGYQVSLEFDPTALRYVSSANGDYLPPGAFFVPPVASEKAVTLGATSLTGVSNGDGTLATVTFEVVDVKESYITLSEIILTDSEGEHLPRFFRRGDVIIPAASPSSAVISVTPTSVLSSAAGKRLTFHVKITGGQDVKDFRLGLKFDESALKRLAVTDKEWWYIRWTPTPLPSELSQYLADGVGNGDGTLARVVFEVRDVKASTISVSGFLIHSNGLRSVPTFESAEIIAPLLGDVNRDGIVNILDLVGVASKFGQRVSGDPADVNEDGVVNIVDLVKVAGALGNGAAAPSAWHLSPEAIPTRADVQQWLSQAQQLNLTDPTSQRGILFLENLLAALTPKETALLANYPNPFNPETWIPYQLAEPANVTVSIYAADGKLVQTLNFGHRPVGIYQDKSRAAYWDGRNTIGEPVASGVYFYTLTAGEFTATRKMLIRK